MSRTPPIRMDQEAQKILRDIKAERGLKSVGDAVRWLRVNTLEGTVERVVEKMKGADE